MTTASGRGPVSNCVIADSTSDPPPVSMLATSRSSNSWRRSASAPSTRTGARVPARRAEVRATQQRPQAPFQGVAPRPSCPLVRIAHVGVHGWIPSAQPPCAASADRFIRRLQRTIRRGADQPCRDRCGTLRQTAPASAKSRDVSRPLSRRTPPPGSVGAKSEATPLKVQNGHSIGFGASH